MKGNRFKKTSLLHFRNFIYIYCLHRETFYSKYMFYFIEIILKNLRINRDFIIK